MSTPSDSKPGQAVRRAFSSAGRLLWELVKRSYAVILIVVILWLSWLAVYYLVSSLMLPARPPSQIVDIPTKLNESILIRSEAKSAQATANPRGPLSHYHRLDEGFQADRFNGCTLSQCHAPLPHGKNKADRAFLNMHATSIHCGVCHAQHDQKPLSLAWYDLNTGKARDRAPALLRAYAWLTEPSIRDKTAFTVNDQTEIVGLLRAAADEGYGETKLIGLGEHLAAVRATSDEFIRLVRVTRDAIQGHFRGEYGAKLALAEPRTKQPLLASLGNKKAVQDFLAHRGPWTTEEKALALKKIHPTRREATLHCTECHRAEGSLVDLPALGYPPARIQAISSPLVTDAIQHVVEGKPFYLPSFLGTEQK